MLEPFQIGVQSGTIGQYYRWIKSEPQCMSICGWMQTDHPFTSSYACVCSVPFFLTVKGCILFCLDRPEQILMDVKRWCPFRLCPFLGKQHILFIVLSLMVGLVWLVSAATKKRCKNIMYTELTTSELN